MAKPKATMSERKFDIKELFFSTTDKRGVILSGNDVFVRVSGYPIEGLIGSPHSIIRHPDMPRIVFKVLWDTIQSKNMIAAYVKNMAADGGFYWVLAIVFPVGDDYLSIRLKPTTPLLEAAANIYKLVLAEEEKNGMEASAAVLFQQLASAGFNTYEEFMKTAITAELKARDEACLQTQGHESRKVQSGGMESGLEQLRGLSENTSNRYRLLFQKISEFESSSQVFRDQVEFLLDSFYAIQLLSLNMRVFAGKLGTRGAALGVIAKSFRQLVESIESSLQRFSKDVEKISSQMQKLTIKSAALKAQVDMVDFFIHESLSKVTNENRPLEEAFAVLEKSSQMFLSLSTEMMQASRSEVVSLAKTAKEFRQSNMEIRKVVNGIELISQIGAVEAARLKDTQVDFKHNITSMQNFGNLLRTSTGKISNASRSLTESIKVIDDTLKASQNSVHDIFQSAFNIDNKVTEQISFSAQRPINEVQAKVETELKMEPMTEVEMEIAIETENKVA